MLIAQNSVLRGATAREGGASLFWGMNGVLLFPLDGALQAWVGSADQWNSSGWTLKTEMSGEMVYERQSK